jgi:hypothetical protein
VRLPAGRYFVEPNVDTPRPQPALPSTTITVNPQLTLDRGTEVTVDARAARPVSITVPDRAAIGMGALTGHWRMLKDLRVASVYGNPDVTALYTAHEGPKVPATEFEAAVGAFYGRPGPGGTTADSRLTYAAAWKQSGRFFTGLHRKVGAAELSTVRAGHLAVAPGRSAEKWTAAELSSAWAGSLTADTTVPFTRIERYAGNVRWINSVTEHAAGTDLADAVVQRQSPATYAPGRRHVERWGETPYWPSARLLREGDVLWIQSLAMFCDASGTREGTGSYRRALVQLHRDGQLVDEADRLEDIPFTLAPDPTRYQLTAEVERDWTDLATRTRVVWTFGSTTAPAGQPVTLPLMSVRFVPADGARGPLAVHVMRAAPGPAVRSLAVEASYDRGRTWQQARVNRAGDRWAAVLPDPPATGAVSLRARAVDGAGDTVEQETVNAYRLR